MRTIRVLQKEKFLIRLDIHQCDKKHPSSARCSLADVRVKSQK